MLASMYRVATSRRESGALHRNVLTGFCRYEYRIAEDPSMSYLDFVHHVERIFESRVREGHLDQGVCGTIHRAEELPAKASRKLALGSSILVCPPRTTRPVIPMLIRQLRSFSGIDKHTKSM